MKNLILPLFFLSAHMANAATLKAVPFEKNSPVNTYKFMTDSEFASAKEQAMSRGKRSIASIKEFEEKLSPEFKKFRARFFALKNVSEIDPLVDELEKNYDKYPTDLKLAAAQIIPLRHFKGIIYRVRGVVEKSKMLHSQLLTGVMNLANNVETYFPDQEARILFDYVSLPYDGVVQFSQSKHVQAHLSKNLYPELVKAAERIKELNFEEPVVMDNQLFYGTAAFKDELDRYRLIGKAEQALLLSRRNRGIAALCRNRAYTSNGITDLVTDIGKLYGVDGFKSQILHRDVDGVTLMDQAKEIKKHKDLFTLYEDGNVWMSRSFEHLKESVKQLSIAWSEAQSRKGATGYVLNADAFTARERAIGKSLPVYEKIISGAFPLKSRVTGETVTVDLPSFYSNPPTDLKVLLPTQYDEGPKEKTVMIKGSKGKVIPAAYYNYYRGRPVAWDSNAYSTIFPKAEDRKDLSNTSRIVAQSWGGEMVGAALKLFIQ